jgi:hypothetical protein
MRLDNLDDEDASIVDLYIAQCQSTDEWAEKYWAEVERKADESLLARIAELEDALAKVNVRAAVKALRKSIADTEGNIVDAEPELRGLSSPEQEK